MLKKTLIYFVCFLSGLNFLSLELLATRIIAPHYGNTIILLGSLLSIMLLGLSIGYFLGGFLIDKYHNFKLGHLVLLISSFFVFIIPELESYFVNNLFNKDSSNLLYFIFFLFFIPSVLLGQISPFIIKLNTKDFKNLGISAGNIYGVSTLGSIAGSLLVSFIFIPNFKHSETIYLISLSILFCSFIFLFLAIKNKEKTVGYTFLVSFILFIFYLKIDKIHSDEKIIYEKNSLYQDIKVVKEKNVLYLKGDNLIQSAQFIDKKDHVLSYTKGLMIGTTFQQKYDSILVVGMGAGTVSNTLLELFPKSTIDSLEIDKDIYLISKKFFNLKEKENHNIILMDARKYLKNSQKKYDLIILDAYKGNYIPFHLLTFEFLSIVKSRLNSNGTLVANTWETNENFNIEINTYKKVFSNIKIYESGEFNRVILYTKNKKTNKVDQKLKRTFNINIKDFFEKEKKYKLTEKYYSDDFVPINFDRKFTKD